MCVCGYVCVCRYVWYIMFYYSTMPARVYALNGRREVCIICGILALYSSETISEGKHFPVCVCECVCVCLHVCVYLCVCVCVCAGA